MTPIIFRPAKQDDFAFCERLYFRGMDEIIRQLGLDQEKQAKNFSQQWQPSEVRIVQTQGEDIGWLQVRPEDDTIFLAQLYLDKDFQRKGIGTQIMRLLMEEAGREGRGMTLGVVKINPALRLYERLGFHTTHEDEHKFYMRRDCAG